MSDRREFQILDPEYDNEFLKISIFGLGMYNKLSDVDLVVLSDTSVVNMNKSVRYVRSFYEPKSHIVGKYTDLRAILLENTIFKENQMFLF